MNCVEHNYDDSGHCYGCGLHRDWNNSVDNQSNPEAETSAEEPKKFAYPIETQRTGNLSISMPRWFEDDEKCGWCGREPGEQHKSNCRQ